MPNRPIQPYIPKWRGTMTDRERYVRQLRHQPVDRCFNMEYGYWDDNFKLWPVFRDHGITTNEAADIFLNFDCTPYSWTEAVWMFPPFPEVEISRNDQTRVLRNADGLLAEVPLDGHDTIHNTQALTPVANIVAMVDAVRAFNRAGG